MSGTDKSRLSGALKALTGLELFGEAEENFNAVRPRFSLFFCILALACLYYPRRQDDAHITSRISSVPGPTQLQRVAFSYQCEPLTVFCFGPEKAAELLSESPVPATKALDLALECNVYRRDFVAGLETIVMLLNTTCLISATFGYHRCVRTVVRSL